MTRRAIAIDLGGTQLRAACVDEQGVISHRKAVATLAQSGPAAVLDQIVTIARAVMADAGGEAFAGVAICAPGPLDAEQGVIVSISTLKNFIDVPVVNHVQQALSMPVTLENDAFAAAVGEWKHGAGQGFSSLVYITVSTGLGGGVIADGKLLRGRRGFAGHIGHMTIVKDGNLCTCGNQGCWEAYASGTAFTQRAHQVLGEAFDAPAVFAAAAKGNEMAQALVDEEGDLLGVGIANLLHLYSPECVIIGGGMANGFTQLYPALRNRIQRAAMPAFRQVPVKLAALADNAGLAGAAHQLFKLTPA